MKIIYIISENCPNSTLDKFINENKKNNKLINEKIIYSIILDLCMGIKEIHNKKIVHRNLKPNNIFIGDDYRIKIGNFKNAKIFQENEEEIINEKIDINNYTAPEIMINQNYNYKIDIWSLGCIIYELCTLNLCFDTEKLSDLAEQILDFNKKEIDLKTYSPEIQNLINILLNKNPDKRPNINEVYEEIMKIDYKKYENDNKKK